MFSKEVIDKTKLVDRSNTKAEREFILHKKGNDYLIAGNPNTDGKLLHELSNSESEKIRKRVAENPSTCLATLFRLLFDTSADVRLALSENPSVPEFFIVHLVNDIDDDVRFGLAENPNLPYKLLVELAFDDNPYVATRAKRTVEQIQCLAGLCAA